MPAFVSVVMPVRNAARFIDEAIDSLRHQTLADFEIIIVDDGSTDASIALAGRQAAGDSRIRILTLPQSGIAVACNHGLVASRGDYVARMDADDVALPQRLERQLAVMENAPSVAVLGTACETIDADGVMIGRMDVPTQPTEIRKLLLQDNCIVHSSTMLRRAAVLAAGGYRPAFVGCEDYDLWLRLAERHDLMNLDQPLLRYRLHDGHASRVTPDRALAMLAAQSAARQRRAELGDPTEV